MASKTSSFAPARRTLTGFTYALRSAAFEWLLIFLLLLDAVFAYLLTRFSRYCRLQVPCLFCSRLDHILGNEKPGFYRDLICTSHKAEMSCLIFCHNHGKLVDGRAMCDDCLLSYSSMLKEKSEMQRVVVGNLGFDLGSNGPPNLFTNKDLLPGSVATKLCSCCRKPWRSRQRTDRIRRLKSPRSAAICKPNIPLPHRLTQQESLRKIREKFSGSLTPCRLGNMGFDSLSHVGYTELKFNSDTESEFQYSDDDEYHNYGQEVDEPPTEEEEEEEKPTTRSDSDKHVDNEMDQQSRVQGIQPYVKNQGERQVLKVEKGKGPSASLEFVLLEDLHPSNMTEVPPMTKQAKNEQNNPSVLTTDSSVLTELMALVDSPSGLAVLKDHFEASKVKGLNEIGTKDEFKNKENVVVKPIVDDETIGTQVGQVAYDVPSTEVTSLEHSETPKASRITIQEKEAPKFMVENLGKREVDEDLKPSSSRESFASSNNVNVSDIHDSTKTPELVFKEKVNDSTLEPLDAVIEGENIDDRLKRQIEHDKILISTLTKELDEERSASAIAANQAMAMITRLQEEKAALHMEALQYLRMMEEQAEYDGEELEKTNDLLAEREKELQDLEAELEYFRIKYGDEDIGENQNMPNIVMSSMSRDDNMNMVGENAATSSSYAEHEVSEHHSGELPNGSEKGDIFTKSSWPDIEDEKSFIFQRLKGLERKLQKLSHGAAASPYMSDNEYSEETTDRGGVGTGEFLVHEEPDRKSVSKGKTVVGSLVMNGQRTSSNPLHETDLTTLKNEISDLNERLESLETDWSFLEHTFNSLESGKEGVQFVQEIAHRLQDLRKIGMQSRKQSVPC
ncbi:unnamed protein product [Linum trigynum]|uniref:GTD-binding domain-containing protein n=1 Tax=Linum trigynum TaxID=586398 RepID=A0AAV2CKP5_9ROSI